MFFFTLKKKTQEVVEIIFFNFDSINSITTMLYIFLLEELLKF